YSYISTLISFAQHLLFCTFLFTYTVTTVIHTLSLHDALPISWTRRACRCSRVSMPPASPAWSRALHCIATSPRWSRPGLRHMRRDRKSTRLNSSHVKISYAVFCLKKKTSKQLC